MLAVHNHRTKNFLEEFMKLRTNKFIAVLCLVAMVASMIVPMFAITANAADTTATIKFDNTSKRTEYSTSKQVWTENGIVVTNDKDKSTSNVGDYCNPARFYKSSKVTIEAPGVITSLTIVGGGESKYKTPIQASLEGAGFSVTVSGDNYTIKPNATSITFNTTAQIRFASISVTYSTGGCDHANKEFVSGTDATCVDDGAKVYNCPDCRETVNETVKAPGHNFVDNVCTECAAVEYAAATVAEALNTADGTKVCISNALVTYINAPYSEQHKNISVTVKDLNSDATLYVYRLAGNVAVGDVITIKGVVATYNGAKQINAGATATNTGTAFDKVPAPVDVDCTEAANLADGVLVRLEGTVTKIDTAWSDSSNNMTVTITDASGKTMQAFKLSTKVDLNDKVVILGTVGNYKGTKQIAEGCVVIANTTEVKAYGAQLLAGTTATSETTAVRLVLQLKTTQDVANIGVALETSEISAKQSTTKVYSSINADGYVVKAETGSVFVLVEIYNIDNASFDEVIHVKPFMTVGDAELYGVEVTFSVSELIAKSAN